MICKKCNKQNEDGYKFCQECGTPLEAIEHHHDSERVEENRQSVVSPHAVYQVPPVYHPYHPMPAKPFTWGDICTVTGFVASIFGIFWFSVILCPIGLGLSVSGFLKNRTKGLAVAGIVVSFISIIIKIGYILYTSRILPEWLTSGVFG